MAIVSKTQLENAAEDVTSLEEFVNGPADLNGTGVVTSRLGATYKTIKKLESEVTIEVEEAISSVISEGSTQVARVTTEGDSQILRVSAESDVQVARVTAEGESQISDINSAVADQISIASDFASEAAASAASAEAIVTGVATGYPDVVPSLLLDFTGSNSLDPRITFSRASSQSYVNEKGLIAYAGVDEPCKDYRADVAVRGWLFGKEGLML